MESIAFLLASLALLPSLITGATIPPISFRQSSTAGGSKGPGTIINSPNGVECTGDSNGVTVGDIVGNLVGCAGVGGIVGETNIPIVKE